jgi:hypothetical protein
MGLTSPGQEGAHFATAEMRSSVKEYRAGSYFKQTPYMENRHIKQVSGLCLDLFKKFNKVI